MFSLLIELVKNIVDVAQKQNTTNIMYREKISITLKEISDVLTDTAEKLKINEYPHANCIILERLSSNLKFYASGLISDNDLVRLNTCLAEASQVEKLFAIRNHVDTIPTIERAAGEFKVLSILVNM